MRKLPAALIAAFLVMVVHGVSYSVEPDKSSQSAQDSMRHDQPGTATVTESLEHPTSKSDSATADKSRDKERKAQEAAMPKPAKPN